MIRLLNRGSLRKVSRLGAAAAIGGSVVVGALAIGAAPAFASGVTNTYWGVGNNQDGASAVTYTWNFTTDTALNGLDEIQLSVPPGTELGTYSPSVCFGLDCDGATISQDGTNDGPDGTGYTLFDVYPEGQGGSQDVGPDVPIFIEITSVQNPYSYTGSFTSTITMLDGSGASLDSGTAGPVSFGTQNTQVEVAVPESVSFENSAPNIYVTPIPDAGEAYAECSDGYVSGTPAYDNAASGDVAPCPVNLSVTTNATGGYTLEAYLSGSGAAGNELTDGTGAQLPNAGTQGRTGPCEVSGDQFGAQASLTVGGSSGAALQGGWANPNAGCVNGYGSFSAPSTIVSASAATGNTPDVISLQDQAQVDFAQPAGVYSGTIYYSVIPNYS